MKFSMHSLKPLFLSLLSHLRLTFHETVNCYFSWPRIPIIQPRVGPSIRRRFILIAQQYFDCFLFILFCWNPFTNRCLAMNVYSRFAIPTFSRLVTIYFLLSEKLEVDESKDVPTVN
jgi:hypothetical protein